MIEQRFTVFKDEYNKSKGVYDNITERRIYQWGHVTRLLNIFNNRYIRRVSELKKENEELIEKIFELSNKNKDPKDKNCHNCKNCETYDEGEGYGFVSLCEKDCMNTDGYFDYEYHRFKKPCVCPFWEESEDD